MQKEKRGFTLIELLVVVLIIGILSAVALPQYQLAVAKSRYSELMALVKHVKMEQEVYYLANGHYAENCEELGGDLPVNTFINSQKRIEDYDGKFVIRCLTGEPPEKPEVAGIFIDENRGSIASYTHTLAPHVDPASFACWGGGALYQKVCKTLCGDLIDGSWCKQ